MNEKKDRPKSWWETQVDKWFDWLSSPEFKQWAKNFFSLKALTFKQKKYVGIGVLAIVVIFFLCIAGPCSSDSPSIKAEKAEAEWMTNVLKEKNVKEKKVGDEYNADVEACVLEFQRQDGYPYISGLYVGAIGCLDEPIKIVQRVDEQSALVKIDVGARGHNTTKHTVFLQGLNLSDAVDDERIRFTRIPYWKIIGTKTYTTAIGGSKTVYVMEPLSRELHTKTLKRMAEIKEIQEAERKKKEAEREADRMKLMDLMKQMNRANARP